VADRSLPIRLKRKRSSEKIERLPERWAEPLAKPIREALARWINRINKELENAQPPLPEQLNDRQQDGAEPLLAIADAAGGDWPVKARAALIELYTGDEAQDESIGVKLLADCRDIIGDQDEIFTVDLLKALNDIPTSPWGESNKGKGLTSYTLASKLKPYGIRPQRGTIRIAEKVGRGYAREVFTDPWERYLPPSGSPSEPNIPLPPTSEPLHPLQMASGAAFQRFSIRYKTENVTDQKTSKTPVLARVVTDVTDKKPGEGENGSNGGLTVCACGSFAIHRNGADMECQTCGSRWGQ